MVAARKLVLICGQCTYFVTRHRTVEFAAAALGASAPIVTDDVVLEDALLLRSPCVMQSSVPKFGSFKPKAQQTANEASSQLRTDDDRTRSGRGSHRNHKSRKSSPHAISHRGLEGLDLRQGKAKRYPHGYTEELFRVDCKGDEDNRRYGSNSKWQIPLYRDTSERFILGDILWRASRAKGSPLAKVSAEDHARLLRGGRMVQATAASIKSQLDDNSSHEYISLRANSKKKQVSHATDTLGLSIETHDSDTTSNTSDGDEQIEEDEDSAKGSNLQQRLHWIQDKVKKHPLDTDAWLEYVDFQEKWVREGLSSGASTQRGDTSLICTKLQLAILDDALKAVSSDKRKQEVLSLRRLGIGSQIWNHQSLSHEWDRVLVQSDRALPVLDKYLAFRKTSAQDFQWQSIRDLYVEVFTSIDETVKQEPQRTLQFSRHTLELTSFLRSSGYTEIAMAIWQVLLHANAAAISSETSFEAVDHPLIESWWDAEGNRPGESGSQDYQSTPTVVDKERNLVLSKCDIWIQEESKRMRQCCLPGKTLDDSNNDDDEDPFRVVLYPDIRPFTYLWADIDQVLDSFLSFCGMPLANALHCVSKDPGACKDRPYDWPLVKVGQRTSFGLPSQSWLSTTETLFAANDCVYFSFKDIQRDDTYTRVAANVLEKHVFTTIDQTPQNSAHIEYFLALTLYLDSSMARKKAKLLLNNGKTQCMRVYLCLALIEQRLKGTEAADRVFELAIKLCRTIHTESAALECIKLWNTWVWQALIRRDTNLALRRIVSSSLNDTSQLSKSDQSTTRAEILRAQDHHRQVRDDALSRASWTTALQAAQLLVTLAYLTTHSLSATEAVVRTNTTLMATYVPRGSGLMAALHQHFAQLMHSHVTLRLAPYSPRELATVLSSSISAFPENGLVLGVYAQIMAHGTRLDDRVRAAVRQVLQIDDQDHGRDSDINPSHSERGITPHLFAIQGELSRSTELGSTATSVRAVFERALKSNLCARSVTIWSLYLNFELLALQTLKDHASDRLATATQSNARRSRNAELASAQERVKSIIYRGRTALPWSKQWVMGAVGVRNVQSPLAEGEKKSLIEGMGDKGLRLHIDADGI